MENKLEKKQKERKNGCYGREAGRKKLRKGLKKDGKERKWKPDKER